MKKIIDKTVGPMTASGKKSVILSGGAVLTNTVRPIMLFGKIVLTNAACVVILLSVLTTCAQFEFDNPLDRDGDAFQCDEWFVNGCQSAPPPTADYTLTVNANPAVGGRVSVEPEREDRRYERGTTVTVTAEPGDDHEFVEWTGAPETADAASPEITFEIDGDVTLTANFREIDAGQTPTLYTLSVEIPDGGGLVTREPNAENYEAGTRVTLTAHPEGGYRFAGWDGDMTSPAPALSFIINSDVTLSANFELLGNLFYDARDGQTYRTVEMPDGKTWFAQNLNFAGISGPIGACYANDDANCERYGRLYTWAVAMNINSSYNSNLWNGGDANHRGICPDGWRVPRAADWDGLISAVGSSAATKLKSQTDWRDSGNGTDVFGFTALPGGNRWATGNSGNLGGNGFWWSTTEIAASTAYGIRMDHDNADVIARNLTKALSISIRCVRN